MNTIPDPTPGVRRRRRLHSDEFKADAIAACSRPGISMAAVALSLGVNANLLRRWVHEAEVRSEHALPVPVAVPQASSAPATTSFVPVQLPAPEPAPVAQDIRVELSTGHTSVVVSWPLSGAAQFAAWMRELLR